MTSPIHALVVDDDAASAALLCALLDKLAVERCNSVNSGRLALEALERDASINLLVCDLRMPDVDGVALMSALPEPRKLPVLIVSGLDESTLGIAFHAAQLRGLDIIGALQKPVSLARLQPVLDALRQRYAQAGETVIPGGREGFLNWLLEGESACQPRPIMRLSDGQLGGLEVEASWGELIHAKSSIDSVARQYGLQRELLLSTLASAGKLHLSWQDCDPDLWMSFALDAAVLADRAFPDLARACISRHWLEPEQIVFEVRHDDVVASPAACLEVIARLRVMGFQIALDAEILRFKTAIAAVDVPFQQLRLMPSGHARCGGPVTAGQDALHDFVDVAHARSALAMAVCVDSTDQLQLMNEQHLDLAAGPAVERQLHWVGPAAFPSAASGDSNLH